jgi:hypothetical protein
MKQLMVLLILGITCRTSYAQNSILAGKVIDINNKPVKGAVIKAGKDIQATSDDDGLFYTKLLPAGTYNVDVAIKGKHYKTTLELKDASVKKVYYYLWVNGNRLNAATTEQDPFVAANLNRLEKNDKLRDIVPGPTYMSGGQYIIPAKDTPKKKKK